MLNQMKSTLSHSISPKIILILPFHLRPRLSCDLFPSRVRPKSVYVSHINRTSSVIHLSHSAPYNHCNNIWRRIITLKLQEKITKSPFWFHISLLLKLSLMNHSVLMAKEILFSSYIQLNNWTDSTINLTIAELWIHHVLSFRIKARTPMQGSQKEEERNFESHNRITLSEVISLNLTICRSTEKKWQRRERQS